MRNAFAFGFVLACWLMAGLTTGCSTTSIQDARGPSELCEVHHKFMKSVAVFGPKGSPPLPPEYVRTGMRYFPHCAPDYQSDPHHKFMIFVCPDCVSAQNAWKQAHPGAFQQ